MSSVNRPALSLRSISRLEGQINHCFDLSERNILFAKKAAALTRHSFFVEAKDIINKLRAININYDPRLSAWVMFAEGQIEHFERLNTNRARDKFIRAHLIGQVAKDRELSTATAAWLAHCDFVEDRMHDSASYLAKAFSWSEALVEESRGRAYLVLADGFSMAGQAVVAKHWYSLARTCAVEAGDIAMQNVMLFNSAAFHVSHITLLDCLSTVAADELKRTKLEVESASNLNAALSMANLTSMIPIMQAELLVIEKQWMRAEANFSQHLPRLEQDGLIKQAQKLLAQRAWCRANIGDIEGARLDLHAALISTSESPDCDDLTILHYRLAATARLLSEAELHAHHTSIAEGYLLNFRAQQQKVVDLFTPIADAIQK